MGVAGLVAGAILWGWLVFPILILGVAGLILCFVVGLFVR